MGDDQATRDRLTGELAAARIVAFPLRGDWVAVQTPADRIPSHGTDLLAQRYAMDLMRLDRPGGRYHPASAARILALGVPTRECYGWGEPVLAMADGEVVVASDGAPERPRVHPLLEVGRLARTAMTFRPDRLDAVLGNHVILRHGDAWSAYVHLVPGSVAVQRGQAVRAGDAIGRLGHTGNSTAPHLHVQLMDGPDPRTARPIPFAFREVEVETPGGWVRVERFVPRSTERIRSVAPSGGGG